MRNAIILIIATIIIVLGALVWRGKISLPFISPNQTEQAAPAGEDNNQNAGETASTETTTTTTTSTTPSKTTTTTKTTNPAMTKDGIYLIYYENTGFKPNSLTIKVGQSVRFVNNSNKAMLIYSTNQQDRTYATLNQSKTVGKGGTYNFMFPQVGVWGYNNYSNPSDYGMVIVTP